jgi:tRNA(fMet)-specific endonuclease VapC
LGQKISDVGQENCFISEITVAELKYGIENSSTIESIKDIVEGFLPKFPILPIYNSLDIYAKEKARLRKQGLLVDDFDILIGATAIFNNLVMVTNNVAHFNRLTNIEIEDWTVLPKKG